MKLLLKWWKRAIGNVQKETKPCNWWKKNGKHGKGKQNYVQVMKKKGMENMKTIEAKLYASAPICKLLGSGGKFYGENFRAWN